MELLNSEMFKEQHKETLYYGKFLYKFEFQIKYLRYFRTNRNLLNFFVSKEIESKIESKIFNVYSENYDHKLFRDIYNDNDIINNIDLIIKYYKWKEKNIDILNEKDYRIYQFYDTVSLYTNDINLINSVQELELSVNYFKCIEQEDKDVKYFQKEPKHKYRIYTKNKYIERKTKNELCDFFSKNESSLFLSSSFSKFFIERGYWLNGSFYVDYDEEKRLTQLKLMFYDLFGKKYKLMKRD